MQVIKRIFSLLLIFPLWFFAQPASVFAVNQPVVNAVLFYSPSCGHCHLVITQTLPPLFEKYGTQLNLVGVDISQQGGDALFTAVTRHFNIERAGVPLLVIGDQYLIGSADIPEKFPAMIDFYLGQGGVDWPPIPELREALAAVPTAQQATPSSPPGLSATQNNPIPETTARGETPAGPPAAPGLTTPTPLQVSAASQATPEQGSALLLATPGAVGAENEKIDFATRFRQDTAGNTLSVIVLVLMVSSVAGGVIVWRRLPEVGKFVEKSLRRRDLFVLLLCLAGLIVAGYLSYVETTQVDAICGPVGDCNTVQQSSYAKLFGFLHIGVLGMIGYVLILIAWQLGKSIDPRQAALSRLAFLAMSAFGLLFSIYLTFLEPFIIGATCAWCLTSAVIMSALFWLALEPGKAAWVYLTKLQHKRA